ncbi:MAG: hypothetical protein NTZ27_05120 [Ignavibacteriales bacterium]|nr:hypothetical protein [Ignavibacteriales bacterium]
MNLFFDRIKNISLWQRLFSWRQIRNLSYDAYEEFGSFTKSFNQVSDEAKQAKNQIELLKKDVEYNKTENVKLNSQLETLNEKLDISREELSNSKSSVASMDETIRLSAIKINDLDKGLLLQKDRSDQLILENSQLKKENTIFKQTETDRINKYEKDISTLNSIKDQIQNERIKEIEEKHLVEIERINNLKETWSNHQENVKKEIKRICQDHTIMYIDKVPFKGSPDNTIKIAEEFVIFDAKSPASDDLNNFATYIKAQTESVKKYVKEENVKKDIFLVIPSNTVEIIHQFSFNMADYNVYVVTLDSIEPIILSLKKIEEYEFVEQLSPEERDNICRVIGKFAHMTKRRIQIDQFFERQFLEILSKCESDLPHDVLEKVIEYEKSEKLNPPQEKRAKLISNKELEADSLKIRKEIEAKEIRTINIQELIINEQTKLIE